MTLVEKYSTFRFGRLLEYDKTPQLVAVDEAIELAKKIDENQVKFINGILSQFVTEE